MSLIYVPTSSYNSFRIAVLARARQGWGYNVDNYLGYQCWDLAAELWMNTSEFEDGNLWPKTGPNLYAEECWTVSKDINKGNSFTLIYNIGEIKRGDVIVIGDSAISETGHIAFADENYNGTTNMKLLGQNQVDPSPTVGHIPTVTELDISNFLGAFRYNAWSEGPTPGTTTTESRLPLILMTRKINNPLNML